MKTMRISLVVSLLLATVTAADLMPAKYDGYTLSPRANCDIRMASEEVNLYLMGTEEINAHGNEGCRVTARFDMVNDTNKPIDLFVGFPVAGEMNRTGLAYFKGVVDGKVPVKNIKKIPKYPENRESWELPIYTWFGWVQSFRPGHTIVEVEYRIWCSKTYACPWLNLYYVLHTGAYWKDSIGQADIVIHFNEPLKREQIRSRTKPDGYELEGNKMRWHLTDFEPTWFEDIQCEYIPFDLYHELEDLRRQVAENDSDVAVALALARHCFTLGNYKGHGGGFGSPSLQEEDYASILAGISGPSDRAAFVAYYDEVRQWPPTEIAESDPNWSRLIVAAEQRGREKLYLPPEEGGNPSYHIQHIISSTGYLPGLDNEYFIEGKEVLERLLAKNPKNADAWNLYLNSCDRFIYAACPPSGRLCPIPPLQRAAIERAYANCPFGGIQSWYEQAVSELQKNPGQSIKRAEAQATR